MDLRQPAIAGAVILTVIMLVTVWWRPAAPPNAHGAVIATIPPLHSLVAGVMEGAGEPLMMLPAGVSPHRMSLRPTDVDTLHRATLVLWVGSYVETFLTRTMRTLPRSVESLRFDSVEGQTLRQPRSGGLWEITSEEDDKRAQPQRRKGLDPHLWLDPGNAAVWVTSIAAKLAAIDPPTAPIYQANAAKLLERLAALDEELRAQLAPLGDVPYLVYHDAYQYLEARYALQPVGAVSPNAEQKPGARRMTELRDLLREGRARCIFVEPQFKPDQVDTLTEGTQVRVATLDPIGSGLTPGPDLYFQMMRGLGRSLVDCLDG